MTAQSPIPDASDWTPFVPLHDAEDDADDWRDELGAAEGDVLRALYVTWTEHDSHMVALGHGLYVTAFLQWNRAPAPLLLAPVMLFAGTGLWLMLPGAGALALPLSVYVLVIGAMIWRAAACALEADQDFLLR